MGYMIWGKLHGLNILVKLKYESKRNIAVKWMNDNKKYYNDMRVYKAKGNIRNSNFILRLESDNYERY